MKIIDDENKRIYFNDQNKIEVKITNVWPMVYIDNCDCDLIKFTINDLKPTINGILCILSIDDLNIDELLKQNNFKELFTICSIEFKTTDFDINEYNISQQVTKEANDYYTNKLQENIDYEIPYQTIKNGFIQYYIFYNKENKIVGILSYYIENNTLFIKEVLSDTKDIMEYMINFVLYKHEISAEIHCTPNQIMLKEVIKLFEGQFISRTFRKFE